MLIAVGFDHWLLSRQVQNNTRLVLSIGEIVGKELRTSQVQNTTGFVDWASLAKKSELIKLKKLMFLLIGSSE